MSVKCCSSVAHYIKTWSYRVVLYFVCLYLCLHLGLLIIYDLFFIIVFILIAINHVISLKSNSHFFTNLTCQLGHFCKKFNVRLLFSFWLNFCQFQAGVAYKSVAYKKSMYFSKPQNFKNKKINRLLVKKRVCN